jgi:hypothetical protein
LREEDGGIKSFSFANVLPRQTKEPLLITPEPCWRHDALGRGEPFVCAVLAIRSLDAMCLDTIAADRVERQV